MMATLNYMNKQDFCMSRAFPWYLFSREFVTKIGCCIVLINHIHPYQNGNHINRRVLCRSTDTFHFPCPIELFNNFIFGAKLFRWKCLKYRTIFFVRISLKILEIRVFQEHFTKRKIISIIDYRSYLHTNLYLN